MKKRLFLFGLLSLLLACRKQDRPAREPSPLDRAIAQVQAQLSPLYRDSVDFSRVGLTSLYQDSLRLLRIPFQGIALQEKFVLAAVDRAGGMTATRIITIKRDSSAISEERAASYDGQIIVQDAGGTVLLHSALINGFIVSRTAAVRTAAGRSGIHVVPGEQPNYIVMPEIVITVNGAGTGQRAWYNLELLMSASGYPSQSGSTTGYYSAAAGSYGPGGYPTGGSAANSAAVSPSTVFTDEPMAVDFEGRPVKQINLESYLKCFGSIPDKGAVCTIELFTDIPVDGQPLVGFNPGTNSPGHTFLQISKKNAGQSIVQNIGFYPEHSYKTLLTTAPVTGVFGDDQHHEFNASMKLELTPTQFNVVIAQMSQLSKRVRYDLDEYNCADFALEVFNFVRGANALEIPRMDIPGTINPYGSNTPQGVYLKLAELKQANGAQANSITIPGEKGYVGNSRGACN